MRQAMAIAEHHPGQLYARNRGMLKMTKSQLHDFASTSEKGLPQHANKTANKAKFRRKARGGAPFGAVKGGASKFRKSSPPANLQDRRARSHNRYIK
jgi:hypothetical protein